jgi:hypothetical protein
MGFVVFIVLERCLSPGNFTLRGFICTILTSLILACPLLCGADEVGHIVQHGHAAENPGNHDDGSIPCPDTNDNCVCQGAVQSNANDLRAGMPDLDESVPTPLLSLDPLLAWFTSLHHHLSRDGSPTGLASWGDSQAICAFLQNFRC